MSSCATRRGFRFQSRTIHLLVLPSEPGGRWKIRSTAACCKPPDWGRRPMAPPPSRRPGYNRKAQYGLFASYVIAVAGALLGLLLAIISIFYPTGFAVVRNMTAEITRPVSLPLNSEERRVGQECVSRCRSRGTPYT